MPKGTSTVPKKSSPPARRSKRLRKSAEGAPTLEPTTSHKKPRKQVKQSDNEDDPQSQSPETDGEGSPPPQESDQAEIRRPSLKLIHPSLRSAWAINKHLPICFIFDTVSPARRFKRGTLFDEDADFPEYDEGESGNVTETDIPPPGLMPYNIADYEYVFTSHH